jgi:hypothetical protein
MNTTQASANTRPVAMVARDEAPSRAQGRLVVIVPDVGEVALLAGRIHLMAQVRMQDVLLMGKRSEAVTEAQLRRSLALLAAFLHDAGIRVEIQVESDMTWIPALRALVRDTDCLACRVSEDQPAEAARLIELLANQFQRPVYAFVDAGNGILGKPAAGWRIVPWLGSVAIIIGFFGLQVWLSQQGEGAAYSGWLLASVPVEIGLIWLFNGLMG